MRLAQCNKMCGIDPDDTPEWYLKLTRKCMDRVQKMTSSSGSTSPKFHHGQCKYLAGKLSTAVRSADMLLNRYKTAICIESFQLLYALSKEVENFIQSCCKDAWIEAVVTLTNVLEHISSIGFNLELRSVVFLERLKLTGRRSLSLTEVDNVFKTEVGIVEEKA